MQWKLTKGKIGRLRSTQTRKMASEGVFTGTVPPNAGKQIIGSKFNNVWLDLLENNWRRRVPSPVCTLLPLLPLLPLFKCNLCRIRKQELLPAIPTGEGVTWLICYICFLDALAYPTLYPQKVTQTVKTIWFSTFFLYWIKATNHLTCQYFGIERKKL